MPSRGWNERCARQAIVVIKPQAEIQRRVAGFDVVLDVRGLLLDRERLVVRERRSAVRQVERGEVLIEIPVLVRECAGGRIGNAKCELLVQPRRAE